MSARWNSYDWSQALAMAKAGASIEEIGAAVGRSRKSIEFKFYAESHSRMLFGDRSRPAPRVVVRVEDDADARALNAAIADRDRRADLRPRSLTAFCFGDPLPGRSALDARR